MFSLKNLARKGLKITLQMHYASTQMMHGEMEMSESGNPNTLP